MNSSWMIGLLMRLYTNRRFLPGDMHCQLLSVYRIIITTAGLKVFNIDDTLHNDFQLISREFFVCNTSVIFHWFHSENFAISLVQKNETYFKKVKWLFPMYVDLQEEIYFLFFILLLQKVFRSKVGVKRINWSRGTVFIMTP